MPGNKPVKPYQSDRQRRWAHTAAGVKALGAADVAAKDRKSKGKKLPETSEASEVSGKKRKK